MVSYLDVDIIVLLLCVNGTEYCDEAELPVGHLDRWTLHYDYTEQAYCSVIGLTLFTTWGFDTSSKPGYFVVWPVMRLPCFPFTMTTVDGTILFCLAFLPSQWTALLREWLIMRMYPYRLLLHLDTWMLLFIVSSRMSKREPPSITTTTSFPFILTIVLGCDGLFVSLCT